MAHNDDDKVTTGEIYRRLCDMDDRYEKKLDRIEDQVRTTNGRTTALETTVRDHGRELGRLNSAVFPRVTASATAAPADAGESVSLKLSPKVWTALAAAGGVLFAMFIEWLKQKIASGQP